MKTILILLVLLCGCTVTDNPRINILDHQAYARQQGWCGQEIAGPGIAYDADCNAYLNQPKKD